MEYFILVICIFTLGFVANLYLLLKRLAISNKDVSAERLARPVNNDGMLNELIKRYESSSEAGERELWLQKILDIRMTSKATFTFLERLTKELIAKGIKLRHLRIQFVLQLTLLRDTAIELLQVLK